MYQTLDLSPQCHIKLGGVIHSTWEVETADQKGHPGLHGKFKASPISKQNKAHGSAQATLLLLHEVRRKGLDQRKLLSKLRAESRFSTSVLDHIDPISLGVGVGGSL